MPIMAHAFRRAAPLGPCASCAAEGLVQSTQQGKGPGCAVLEIWGLGTSCCVTFWPEAPLSQASPAQGLPGPATACQLSSSPLPGHPSGPHPCLCPIPASPPRPCLPPDSASPSGPAGGSEPAGGQEDRSDARRPLPTPGTAGMWVQLWSPGNLTPGRSPGVLLPGRGGPWGAEASL